LSLSKILNRPSEWSVPAIAHSKVLSAAVQGVLKRWPDVVPEPDEKDREILVQTVKSKLDNDDWKGTRMSLMVSAARALFDETRRVRRELLALRVFYFEETKASTSSTFIGAMAAVYFGSYVPNAPHTRQLADALRSNRDNLGASWGDLFRRVPDCLDAAHAPDSIAKLMVSMADPWGGLKVLGIRLPHAPGLMDYVHLEYVKLLRPKLKSKDGIDRLFGWLRPKGQQPRTSGAAEAISAVLSPWMSRDPSADLISYITEWLVGSYEDPRLKAGGVWSGVKPDAMAVLMRWLTGENIRFFLDTVTEVESSHMWAPRREFWLGLYEQGYINAAWVAFSDEAARLAQRRIGTESDGRVLSFGRQVAGGSRLYTSLLILQIGNKIIVEGSHSYMVHVFKKNSPRIPQLYQPTYDCEQLRLIPDRPSGFHESKVHDAYGNWRNWVLERI
jgi:hypothetical protein